jgi:hypothetical protein
VQSSGSLSGVFVLALVFIFLVLAAQFESFVDPFVILLSVPLSMVGALLALQWTGSTLNVYAGGTGPTVSGKGTISPGTGSAKTPLIIIPNFPFQKWVYLCINVDENTMDAYLNGKLVKSVSNVKDANSPNPVIRFSDFGKSDPITVGNNGVKGKLARFRREARLLDPQNVWNIYIQGPGVTDEDDNGTGDYHSKFNITRNNRVIRKFNLF